MTSWVPVGTPAVAPQTLTGAAAALNADAVPSTDVRGYSAWSVVSSGTWSGTLAIQGSNDNVTWHNLFGWYATTIGIFNGTWNSNTYPFQGQVMFRYLRVRMTGYTSGSATVYLNLSTVPAVHGTLVTFNSSIATMSGANPSDGMANQNTTGPVALSLGYNGSSWDMLRTAKVFKTATAVNAGSTPVWTPTTGKRFRLLSYAIQLTGGAAADSPGDLDLVLYDGATPLPAAMSVFVPNVAGAPDASMVTTGWVDLGNGIPSSGLNVVLNANLSFALKSGKARVLAAGTEEL